MGGPPRLHCSCRCSIGTFKRVTRGAARLARPGMGRHGEGQGPKACGRSSGRPNPVACGRLACLRCAGSAGRSSRCLRLPTAPKGQATRRKTAPTPLPNESNPISHLLYKTLTKFWGRRLTAEGRNWYVDQRRNAAKLRKSWKDCGILGIFIFLMDINFATSIARRKKIAIIAT